MENLNNSMLKKVIQEKLFLQNKLIYNGPKGHSNNAVEVRNAKISYEKGHLILNNLNMTVLQGTSYGLLGASGCGKTTILSCITGLNSLDEGYVTVFGKKPGSKDSGIPGLTLGYMPQDMALYDLSISEILSLFGKIYGLSSKKIEERTNFLIKFLDLPSSDSHINCLSGGQKRRVSLSIALIHEPKILILDEPTVGVDSALRESIWRHLNEIVEEYKTTLIITTHYIDEARQCDTVGIMRSGRLMAEDSPKNLLTFYNSKTLEDVFLKLCYKDEEEIERIESSPHYIPVKNHSKILPLTLTQGNEDFCYLDLTIGAKIPQNENLTETDYHHGNFKQAYTKGKQDLQIVLALAMKNVLTYYRFPLFTFALTVIPLLQTILGILIVGVGPKNTSFGIVNYELIQEYKSSDLRWCHRKRKTNECFTEKISCKFFDAFKKEDFSWIPYSSEQEALESVQQGKSLGYLVIPYNYTAEMKERALYGNYVGNETLDKTVITSRLDLSAILKAQIVMTNILLSFQTFLKKLVSSCGGNAQTIELPFKFHAIYGDTATDSGFPEYLLPGFHIAIIFLIPMANAYFYIKDRNGGTLQRCILAGVKLPHILASNAMTECVILSCQIGLCLGCLIFYGGLEIKGSTFLFLLIVFLQGITGLSCGFFFGNFCKNEMEALIYITGMYSPILISSGIVWPLNGLNYFAHLLCKCLPTTIPIIALRSVLTRGFGIFHPQVWPAFLVMAVWITAACSLSALCYKKSNNKKQ